MVFPDGSEKSGYFENNIYWGEKPPTVWLNGSPLKLKKWKKKVNKEQTSNKWKMGVSLNSTNSTLGWSNGAKLPQSILQKKEM